MANKTFYITNADTTGTTCIPRSHPHEATFKKGQAHTLHFKNLTNCLVQLNLSRRLYDGFLVPFGPHNPKDEKSRTTVDIRADDEGVYRCTLTPLATTCPACGHKLSAGPEVVQPVSGGSGQAETTHGFQLQDGGGDPIIIIDPEA